MMNGSGWDHMDRLDRFGTTLMFVVWIVVLLAVISLVAQLLNGSRLSGPVAGDHDRAVEILRERYARGELSDEEYAQAYETLGQTDQNPAREPR